jgi:hypothetical protein
MKVKRKYNIIFRTCDSVNSFNKSPRPFDLTKSQLIKICFLSLIESLEGFDYRLIILGDELSDEIINFFNFFKVEMHLGSYGNYASIRESLNIADTISKDEWIYFCEDDYLHVPSSFSVIDNFINERDELFRQQIKLYNLSSIVNLQRKDLFIHPPDYPDRYKPKYRKHSLILLSKDCHWRQINSVTFTFLTESATVKKYSSLLMACSINANDRRLSRRLFGRIPLFANSICFSPLPGLSTHMHQDTMTPLVNWGELVYAYSEKIRLLKY